MRGDWRKAYEYLAGLTSWNLIPAKEDVLAMLKAKLQQEGLRTYLLTYGAFYHSLSQDQLCDMFDMSEKEARYFTASSLKAPFSLLGADLPLCDQGQAHSFDVHREM